MTQKQQNFEVYQGDDKDVVIDLVDDDDVNEPDELEAGATCTWRLSKYPDSTPVLTIPNDDIDILSYNPGIVKFRIEDTDSTSLRGTYYHEFEIDEPTYGKSTIATGNVWVEESNE